MLFDLEDYVNWGIIGPNSKHPKLINWEDAYTTSRATRDAYLRSVNEYFLAAHAMSTPAEFQALKLKHVEYLDKLVEFGPKYRNFWNAMMSLPLVGVEGFTDGTRYNIISVGKYEQNSNYYEFPTTVTDTWWLQNYRKVAVIDTNGDNTYTELTADIIVEHKYSFASFMATIKDILVTAEGSTENLTDWVIPEVMPFETYPEVTGYVRGTNSLPIKDAIVRLVDADGVSHEVITDDKGYYKFSNEYVYNNVALTAAGATNSFIDGSFNMFLLDHKQGSTASLYNKTSKFENSFFGAENNRFMTWPVYVKMGRNNRRNFKIEFIPNYSNFPSFSGYVKDVAGNPITDALVVIKDQVSGYSIGQYRKPNGDDAWNYKYNDFGVDRTILTDENGFYEYTSQMVGEWFNKHGFVEYNMPTTILSEPTRAYEETGSNTLNRWLMSNEFIVYLIPYKQDANSTSMNWSDGTAIYDNNDFAASRFEYGLYNQYGHFYYRDIEMGQNNVFNVDVVPAVGNEFMADKIKMTCTPGSRNISCQIQTTTNYVKFVFSNGVSEVKQSGWIDFASYNYGYDTTMFSEEFYVYSCDSDGRAFGYITQLVLGDTEFSNVSNVDFSETEHLAKLEIWGLHASDLDLSGLKKLKHLYLTSSQYLESVTGLQDSKYLSKLDLQNTNRLTYIPLENFDWLSEVFVIGTALSSFDISTCGKKANAYGAAPLGSMQVELNGMENLQSINFGFVGHKPYSESTESNINISLYNCKKLLVDDVDLLLQQLADSGKHVNLYSDKARSSDSDVAYDTLINRNSYLGFSGSEYFESNEEKKSIVMYVDPSFGPDSNNMQKTISLNGNVSTTTGYFRLNAWFDNGYPMNYNIYQGQFNREINVEFDDTFESRPIEIYSTDQYGRPSGSITSIDFCTTPTNTCVNIIDLDLSQVTEITYLGVRSLGITSLDITSNVLLQDIFILNLGKLETIYVDGLTSLHNLYLENLNSLVSIEGIETLTGLTDITLSNCQELDFVSLSTFDALRTINLSNVFKYDSTHVDTMLSELKLISDDRVSTLNTLLANKQSERDFKLTELSVFDAQEPTISTLAGQLDTLYTELNQLISDGADQSLVDSKQVEVNTKSAELSAKEVDRKLISNQVDTLDSEISDLNSQISNPFSGYTFGTGYMARTSASDADYDSLLTYGWNLYIGSEFVAPYTLPVKGYIALDWEGNEERYLNFRYLQTSTEYYRFKDGMGNIYSNYNFYAYKGVLEFWSVDQFGRPGGQFTGVGFDNEFATSVDFDNLTSLTTLSLGETKISTIDVSSLTNLVVFECMFDRQLTSIAGLSLLANLETLYLRECHKLTSVDTSGLESLTTLYLDTLPSLSDIDISVIGSTIGSTFSSLTSLTIYNQSFETPKYLDVHANINNISYNYFRTFTSADLDTLLVELDANGQSNGNLNTGYVARTEASDVAFNNLQSKGWNLGIGSYFIGPNEVPAKGYIHFEDTTVNESISFYLNSETNYFMIKYPNGTIDNCNSGWTYYEFNSSIPSEERIIEVYGTDQFGRPTDSITNITELRGCSSVEFSALKKLSSVGLDQNNRITTLNLDDVVSLESVFTNNCPLLETISIVGCTASKRDSYINSCPLLDIDAFLIQLDETGSLLHDAGATIYADQNYGSGFTPARTHASDAAVESLQNKGFILNVAEPAGESINFSYISGEYLNINLSTSTGYVKLLFPLGTPEYTDYPDGRIFGNGNRYVNIDNYPSFTIQESYGRSMNLSIVSCLGNGQLSGEIKFFQPNSGLRNLALSTLSKVEMIVIGDSFINSFSNSLSFNGMSKLKSIEISGNPDMNISSIDISTVNSKLQRLRIAIPSMVTKPQIIGFDCPLLDDCYLESVNVTGLNFANSPLLRYLRLFGLNKSTIDLSALTSLIGLDIRSCVSLTNLNVSNTILESIYCYDNPLLQNITGLSTISNTLRYLILHSSGIVQLDFTGFSKLWILEFYNLPSLTSVIGLNSLGVAEASNVQVSFQNTGITSLDFSNSRLYQLSLENNHSLTSLNFTNCINFWRVWVYNGHSNLTAMQGLLTTGLQNFYLYSSGSIGNLDLPKNNMYEIVIIDSAVSAISGLDGITSNQIVIRNTNVQSLDFSNSTINNLSIGAGPVTSLNLNNTAVIDLGIQGINITNLDFSTLSNRRVIGGLSFGNMSSLTSITFGSWVRSNIYYIGMYNMPNITSVDFTGFTKLYNLNLTNINGITSTGVDDILIKLAANGKSNGYFYFPGYSNRRTSSSDTARATLISRNWNLQG